MTWRSVARVIKGINRCWGRVGVTDRLAIIDINVREYCPAVEVAPGVAPRHAPDRSPVPIERQDINDIHVITGNRVEVRVGDAERDVVARLHK